jgi:hypothetical protein
MGHNVFRAAIPRETGKSRRDIIYVAPMGLISSLVFVFYKPAVPCGITKYSTLFDYTGPSGPAV